MCDCCPAIKCPVDTKPVDTDGDGCADTCKPIGCDLAISGQCEGFDYTKQCDLNALDCGNNAILADSDCDGQYDVCQLCPAGTHPVDSNGDGCEDMCDCCPAIKCPVDTKPVDTDGDGCADTCKPLPCDDALFGQCEDHDYTAQCNPLGFDCGSNAILGDKDCDGKYDVCQLCPPGTAPVDSNGDGCEDMCDCTSPVDPVDDAAEGKK